MRAQQRSLERAERHRLREKRKLRSLDLSGAAQEHRQQEAERAKAQRAAERAAEGEAAQVEVAAYGVAVSTNGNTIFLAPGQPRQSFPCQPAIGQTYGVLH